MLPLALLHGFTGAPSNFAGVIAALRPEICAVPPLWGHGARTSIAPGSFEAEVDRLAAELRASAPQFHVVGYSLGGRLAVGLLVRHPRLFRSATLIGAQPGLASEAERSARREADERWCTLIAENGMPAFVDAWEALPLFASQKNAPEKALAAQRRIRSSHDAEGLIASLKVTGLGEMPSYWGELDRISVPTTLMVGSLDGKFTAIAREMAARLPHATVQIVPGAGHNLLLEAQSAVTLVLRAALEAE
jgi:2-succinyl-6-hydroxy-2,4-cyclohexadiene-1-carboxylate synthase